MGAIHGRRRTRIQAANEEKILAAALDVFSAESYGGATIDQIADAAGMSKPNLLYYFSSKDAIYRAVLERTLDGWLEPLRALDPDGDPIAEIRAYILRKLDLAREKPRESRLFAGEMLRGAPVLGDELRGPLRALVEEKAKVISAWAEAGRIAAVDPRHLLFAIWATTQTYADFDVQIRAVLGGEGDEDDGGEGRWDEAGRALDALFCSSLSDP